ncbi:MAG: hypothetical protein KGI91_05815 [Burkholderiales bacterium]|nr:hypothetical protein [Burkholderiales bacterium]MDE2076581.1 hypothetical protein [Burkholderiales bacterium]MDE2433848.1 hypothetical protein [Burkholderiales bacterium]
MSRSIRLLALTTLLLTLALLLRWVFSPDSRTPVRLIPHPAATHLATPAPAIEPPAPSCTMTDLNAWQMPMATDPSSQRATLYSDGTGTRRVAPGDSLTPQVKVERVSSSQVMVACMDGRLRRVLTAPQASTRPIAPDRPPAPFGN